MNFVKKQWARYKSLPPMVKASLWFMVCSVLQKCITFITLPLFTRLLTQGEYGQLSIYQAWLGIVCIFTTLNLQYGSFNKALIKYEKDREGYMASVQTIGTVLTILFIGIYFIAPGFWNGKTDMTMIMTMTMFMEILFCLPIGLWTTKQRFDYKYKSLVAVTLVISILQPVVGLCAVLLAKDRAIARIISFAAVYVAIGLIFYIYYYYKSKRLFVWEHVKFALRFNIPLVPYYLSQTVFNMSDRLMINWLCGNEKAGIYSVAYQLSLVMTFVLNAIANSLTPWVFQKIRDKEHNDIAKVVNGVVFLLMGLMICLMLFGPEVILIMAGEKYMEAIWIIPPVSASVVFLFMVQTSINFEFYFEKNLFLVYGSIGSAVLNIVLNYFCIRWFGYYAAGYTTLASYLVFWIANYLFMVKLCRANHIQASKVVNFRFQVIVSVFFLAVTLVINLLYLNNYVRYSLIAAGLIFVIIRFKWLYNKVLSVLSFRKKSSS